MQRSYVAICPAYFPLLGSSSVLIGYADYYQNPENTTSAYITHEESHKTMFILHRAT